MRYAVPVFVTCAVLLLASGPPPVAEADASTPPPESYLIQAESMAAARAAAEAVGGTVTHDLEIIAGVAAELTAAELAALRQLHEVRISADGIARTATSGNGNNGNNGNPGGDDIVLACGGRGGAQTWDDYLTQPYTWYPAQIGADGLHTQGLTGEGVTIAIVDTGLFGADGLGYDTAGDLRVLARYDAIRDDIWSPGFWYDRSGHGSHVAATAVNSDVNDADGRLNGVAPDADLVVVQAFDRKGQGTYADIIRGIDWVVANRDSYGIRVLNLSFGAPPRSWYWEDPLNQAVMQAWQAGIVVVTSAGNAGPDPMTIGVPGNVPYVITVGGTTDACTRLDESDDSLMTASSAGPTYE
ncbi:MAG: S8 family serine peptidase, partial [Gemmatimonadetes bacterium]|nr:S8 family serine peptidase [Gemmatimonadota bacterium]